MALGRSLLAPPSDITDGESFSSWAFRGRSLLRRDSPTCKLPPPVGGGAGGRFASPPHGAVQWRRSQKPGWLVSAVTIRTPSRWSWLGFSEFWKSRRLGGFALPWTQRSPPATTETEPGGGCMLMSVGDASMSLRVSFLPERVCKYDCLCVLQASERACALSVRVTLRASVRARPRVRACVCPARGHV